MTISNHEANKIAASAFCTGIAATGATTEQAVKIMAVYKANPKTDGPIKDRIWEGLEIIAMEDALAQIAAEGDPKLANHPAIRETLALHAIDTDAARPPFNKSHRGRH